MLSRDLSAPLPVVEKGNEMERHRETRSQRWLQPSHLVSDVFFALFSRAEAPVLQCRGNSSYQVKSPVGTDAS